MRLSRKIFGSAQDLISAIQIPLSEGVERAVNDLIDKESKQAAQTYQQEELEKLNEVGADARGIRAQVEQHRTRLDEAEQELRLKQAESGSLVKAVIFIGCFIGCFVAEFVLMWDMLPFILSVNRFSFVGVVLAIAPTTALVILGVVFDRLIEKPWQKAQSGLSTMRRRASWAVMTVFLFGLCALNVYTVLSLASAREESLNVTRKLELLEGEGEI
jgi:hypothetical protein